MDIWRKEEIKSKSNLFLWMKFQTGKFEPERILYHKLSLEQQAAFSSLVKLQKFCK